MKKPRLERGRGRKRQEPREAGFPWKLKGQGPDSPVDPLEKHLDFSPRGPCSDF